MWPVSDAFKRASGGGGELATTVTATPPGGEPVDLTWLNVTVTKSLTSGARFQANAEVAGGEGAFDLLALPGTRVAIDHGFRFSRSASELIPMGRYEVVKRPEQTYGENVSCDLADTWSVLEECRFLSPRTVAAGAGRRAAIVDAVLDAIPGQGIADGPDDGGTLGATTVFERDRTDMLATLARDGGLDPHFTAEGLFRVDALPMIADEPVRVFTDADGADAGWVTEEAQYTRLYNCVVVTSSAESPLFAPAVEVHIADPAHPRHRSKIGVRPYFLDSPTIGSGSDAFVAGERVLSLVAQPSSRIKGSSFGLAYLEPGDTVGVAVMPDVRFLVETVTHNCATGASTFEGRSVSEIPAEEGS
jgi:hypothetical protein